MIKNALAGLWVTCVCVLAAYAGVTIFAASVPSPWSSRDIGSVGLSGSATYVSSTGVFTLNGAGADIWGSSDAFQFVSQSATGDVTLIARVATEKNTDTYAKAGLMFRETLGSNSAHVILDIRPSGQVEFMIRPSTGADTTFIAGGTQTVPGWLKLTRSGNSVMAYVSANGSSWSAVGATSVSMASTINVGLAVTSHTTSVRNTSTFDKVSVAASGTVTQQQQQPPSAPASPTPASGSTGLGASTSFAWSSSGASTYDISLGTANPPPAVATGLTSASYSTSSLAAGVTYYWQVVARNAAGSTAGPVWSLTTASSSSSGGTTRTVNAGGDLQAAINAAQPGDTIVLQAGATFTGNFILPNKSGSSYITIRSSASDASLPGSTTRMDPSYSGQLPKIRSLNSNPAIATAAGAHHYKLMFLEFLSNYQGMYDVLALGAGDSSQNTLASVPHDFIVDRVYMHGDPTYGQKRAIALHSATTSILNSYISEIKADTQDSQAICGWNGPGPYTIKNNYLEAAGENVLFGGADPSIPNLVPSDITFTGNYLTKQTAWRGQQWSIKTLFELKNAQRLVIDGNVFENNWQADQQGYAIAFTPRNQNGTAPWSVVQQIQFTNNVVRHVSSGFNILGTDNEQPSQLTNNITIRNNLLVDVSAASYGGDGRFMLLGGGSNITIDHNTVLSDGSSTVYPYGSSVPGFTFTNNIIPNNIWAFIGDNTNGPGNPTITQYFPNGLFLGGIYAAANPAIYPTGNFYPASMSAVGFVSYSGGNYRLSSSSLYRLSATDGTDIGCNIDALNAAAGTKY